MFKQMKMETRLHAGFGLVVVLVVLLGVIAFSKLTSLHNQWTDFETITLTRKNAVLEAVTAHGRAVRHFKNFILRGPDSNAQFRSELAIIDKEMGVYRDAGALSAEEQVLLGEVQAGVKAYDHSMSQLEAMHEKGMTALE